MASEPDDAVVVGSGPNGLAAAIALAEAGRSVRVLEARPVAGGGLRTEELLEPGFRHDVCSTVMALPPLLEHFDRMGLDLVAPPAPLAHPFDDGTAVVVERSVEDTARAYLFACQIGAEPAPLPEAVSRELHSWWIGSYRRVAL